MPASCSAGSSQLEDKTRVRAADGRAGALVVSAAGAGRSPPFFRSNPARVLIDSNSRHRSSPYWGTEGFGKRRG